MHPGRTVMFFLGKILGDSIRSVFVSRSIPTVRKLPPSNPFLVIPRAAISSRSILGLFGLAPRLILSGQHLRIAEDLISTGDFLEHLRVSALVLCCLRVTNRKCSNISRKVLHRTTSVLFLPHITMMGVTLAIAFVIRISTILEHLLARMLAARHLQFALYYRLHVSDVNIKHSRVK